MRGLRFSTTRPRDLSLKTTWSIQFSQRNRTGSPPGNRATASKDDTSRWSILTSSALSSGDDDDRPAGEPAGRLVNGEVPCQATITANAMAVAGINQRNDRRSVRK